MDVFADNSTAEFQQASANQLRELYPAKWAEWGDALANRNIRAGVAKSKSYSVSRKDDVFAFLRLIFEYGPDFETKPPLAWAGEVLNDTDMRGTMKMALIARRKGGA